MAGFLIYNQPAEAEIGENQKMTLKIYNKADDIPEGLRSEYKQSGTKWVPDLSDDHPVLVLNKTLVQEKDLEEAKVKKLRADLDDALEASKTSGIPRGHVAVPKADAELINEVKALGPVADLKTRLTDFDKLQTDLNERKRADNFRLVAKELGYNEAAFLQLSNLPDIEIRDTNGKKSVVALVKDGDKVTERPANEFVESTYAPLIPALKTTGDMQVPGSGGGNQPVGKNAFDSARKFGEQWNEAAKAGSNVMDRFSSAKVAT